MSASVQKSADNGWFGRFISGRHMQTGVETAVAGVGICAALHQHLSHRKDTIIFNGKIGSYTLSFIKQKIVQIPV